MFSAHSTFDAGRVFYEDVKGRLAAHGRSGHSARPWQADSAAELAFVQQRDLGERRNTLLAVYREAAESADAPAFHRA